MTMKYIYLLTIFSFCFLVESCKTHEPVTTAQVNYLGQSDGTITMRCVGVGDNREAISMNAEKNALNVLLFRGLPGSMQATPMIDMTENEAKTKYPAYLEELLEKGRYKTFIMSSVTTGELSKADNGAKQASIDIKVNVASLRRDLENNNIIRKFGF